ncbi:olfactory receptor 181-like, partial [Poecilia formosa]|uniref:olfactory receptor 181-like n=1 Tax=Poecilia formosa TaxID=48698 RepID=UPI0007B7D63A
MENFTYNSFMLQLEAIDFTKDVVYTAFFLFLAFYIFTMSLNLGFLILVITEKNLHQPMYILFCKLTVSDIIAATEVFPRLLVDILRPPSERLISYYECMVQAFLTHLVNSTCHTVLMIMAFDRYVAICNPLRYSAIMTSRMLVKLSIAVICLTSRNKSMKKKALKTCSTHLVVYLILLFSGFSVIALHRFPQYSYYRKILTILFFVVPGSLNTIIYGVQSKEIRNFLSEKIKTHQCFQLKNN